MMFNTLRQTPAKQRNVHNMKTTICLPMPPSVNGLFDGMGTRRFISDKYKAWRLAAGVEIMRQRPKPVKGQVVLFFVFQEKDKRKRDVSNYIKAPEDLLVQHGLIEADDSSIVREVRAKWSADVEGMRVTIQDLASTIFKDEQAA
jgi:crossover junction endodeoxyribonuclease RusA